MHDENRTQSQQNIIFDVAQLTGGSLPIFLMHRADEVQNCMSFLSGHDNLFFDFSQVCMFLDPHYSLKESPKKLTHG